jgi:NAD(P)H-flavin reductase
MQYTPELAKLNKVEKLTAQETFFEVELLERKSLGHKPGQFVAVSVLGVGEAPISISSPPTPAKPTFQLVVRAAGNVTSALAAKKSGDKIGIRGPFGNGFDITEISGKDILFVAGGLGLVPLRSLIWSVLERREDFGKIFILYGAKRPAELLFKDELKQWEERKDLEFHLTVDLGDEAWTGNIGVITTLFPFVKLDPRKTAAAVIGPPVMFRFVLRQMQKIPEDQIYLSLERRMKCGLGKCGHCQINQIYVCQDGPVFKLSELRKLPEAI